MRRLALLVGLVLALMPSVAHADAAGPTDYRTTIQSVTPAVDGLTVSIEGGDAFIRLRAPAGREVIVLGYAGEPYLRFTAGGAVSENRLSSATYENAQRFGVEEIPSFVDNAAPPEWRQVASTGVWSWHDHRAHWMADRPLIGLEPGDSLPAEDIPILVDGQPVEITVVTTLAERPAGWPPVFGAIIGCLVALLAIRVGPASMILTAGVAAGAALVVGGAQFLSLPAETEPLVTWWLLPAIAIAAVVANIAWYGRSELLRHGLVAVAAGQLLLWSVGRRSALTKAVLPTDLPFPLDRAMTAGVLVVAALLLGTTLWSLVRITIDPARISPTS